MRSGLPDGLLVSLLLRHLSMMRVMRWGILRFMMGIWYGALLNSEYAITISIFMVIVFHAFLTT